MKIPFYSQFRRRRRKSFCFYSGFRTQFESDCEQKNGERERDLFLNLKGSSNSFMGDFCHQEIERDRKKEI